MSSRDAVVGFAVVAAALAGGCVRELADVAPVASCGAPADTYVASRTDDDGREIFFARLLPPVHNCEGEVLTRLRYDAHGVLIRREDELRRCGVLERSVVAVRGVRGWTLERVYNRDHDERVDERSRSFVAAAAVEPSEQREPLLACAITQAERRDGAWSAVK